MCLGLNFISKIWLRDLKLLNIKVWNVMIQRGSQQCKTGFISISTSIVISRRWAGAFLTFTDPSHICPFVKTGPFCSWAKWLCCEPSELPQISQPLHRFMRIRLAQTTSLQQNEQLIVPTVQQLNDKIIRFIMTLINMNLLLHTYLYLGFCFSSSCQNLKNPIIYRRNWLKDLFETAIWKSRDFPVSGMDP